MSSPEELYQKTTRNMEKLDARDREHLETETARYQRIKNLIYRLGYSRSFWNPRNGIWITHDGMWNELDYRSNNIKNLHEKMLRREGDLLKYHNNHTRMMEIWGS